MKSVESKDFEEEDDGGITLYQDEDEDEELGNRSKQVCLRSIIA